MSSKDKCYTETIKINIPMTDIRNSSISNYVCVYYYRDTQDAKFGLWSQLKRCLYFDSQHHHDRKALKKKKTITFALGFSHLKIQRHLDAKLYFELTFFVRIKNRRDYRYLLKMLNWNRVKVGCAEHHQLSSGGVQAAELQLSRGTDGAGSTAHGGAVKQRRSSVRCPPPPPAAYYWHCHSC